MKVKSHVLHVLHLVLFAPAEVLYRAKSLIITSHTIIEWSGEQQRSVIKCLMSFETSDIWYGFRKSGCDRGEHEYARYDFHLFDYVPNLPLKTHNELSHTKYNRVRPCSFTT